MIPGVVPALLWVAMIAATPADRYWRKPPTVWMRR